MFRTVSITSLIIIVAGIVCHFAYSRPKNCSMSTKKLLMPKNGGLIAGFRVLVFLGAIACFAVLLFTGFFPKLVLKETISGYWLMAHATAAPPFIACLAILALMWPGHSSLRQEGARPFGEHEFGVRVAFWIVMVLSLPLIMSIVLSMLPVYGTHMQEVMADVHRYTALAVAGASLVYIYLSILTKAKQQNSAQTSSVEARKAG